MSKRIFRAIFLVATAVLLAGLAVLMGVLYRYVTAVQKAGLSAQAALAVRGVQDEGLDYLTGVNAGGSRVTWVAADGTVLYDSVKDASGMENHLMREEIRAALDTGTGWSERMSDTLTQKTLYYAQRLIDGTVLRLSVTQSSVLSLAFGMLPPVCLVLAAAIALSAILARRLSRRIVGPLNTLDLDRPLDNEAYDELSPLLTRIERQHRQIEAQMAALKEKQDEFSAVTAGMSEGLVLLNDRGMILSINPAAARLFETDESCVGQDILTVERSLDMQRLIAGARGGRRMEAFMRLSGREYQLTASPVPAAGPDSGVCILAFDVTERQEAETQRREFSANVSHELKTPLHAIMGSAELIENGLVKPADMPRFNGHIRQEATRLVTLIDDIIRLSQLDEGGEMPRERVALRALADEAAGTLSEAAAARGVTICVHGGDAAVTGVRRLLAEIVYNLMDNAVKYNRDGGRVDVTLAEEDGAAVLTVADTGVGIPQSAQAHVFERFYRVDKSHSRETGGTGLGLSIVKHAAAYHNATITLLSREGEGARITLRFPADAATN